MNDIDTAYDIAQSIDLQFLVERCELTRSLYGYSHFVLDPMKAYDAIRARGFEPTSEIGELIYENMEDRVERMNGGE